MKLGIANPYRLSSPPPPDPIPKPSPPHSIRFSSLPTQTQFGILALLSGLAFVLWLSYWLSVCPEYWPGMITLPMEFLFEASGILWLAWRLDS